MRKTVLLFGHSYATQFIDISNQYTKLFDPAQYEVTVAYLVGKPDENIVQKHTADHVIFLDASKRTARGLKISIIRSMLKLCREKKFDIVVCHRYKPTYVMLWVSQFVRIPALFSVMHELGTLSSFSRKLIIGMLARKNLMLAGVSNAVRDDLRKNAWRIPSERIITLYNMIDVEWTENKLLERHIAREQLNLDPDSFVFGNIGRLAKNKDQKTLIQAFALCKPHMPNAKLIIFGDGILEETLKQQVHELQLTNDVIFTGFVPESFRFLPAVDVLISASIQEAFGRVLLEAMIAKTPVIATRVNGVPEVIGDAGVLIPAGDANLMKEKMLHAYQLSKEERAQWGKQGYQRALKDFSLQKFNEVFWNLPLCKI